MKRSEWSISRLRLEAQLVPAMTTDRAWQQFLDVLTGQASSACCPTLDELQIETDADIDNNEPDDLSPEDERLQDQMRRSVPKRSVPALERRYPAGMEKDPW